MSELAAHDVLRAIAPNGTHSRPKWEPSMSSLAVKTTALLNDIPKGKARERKQQVSEMITGWLIENRRLLRDESDPNNPQPYLLTDNAEAQYVDPKAQMLQYALHDAGVNASEEFFRWLVHDIQAAAHDEGRRIILSRWSMVRDGVLYVSAGRNRYVRATPDGKMEVRTNGVDDIVFAAESTFPEWVPDDPLPIFHVTGFTPRLEAPAEVPTYSREYQLLLMEAWMVGMMLNVRPLPLLTAVGQQSSGKSTTMKLLVQLVMGPAGNLGGIPAQQKDFNACATSLPVYGIDNLDRPADAKWLPDALATATTGGTNQERKLYANDEVHRKAFQASLIVTTRTATFAQHSDIAERVLPLFFGPIEVLIDPPELEREVLANRNRLLSYLVTEAARLLGDPRPASGLPGRFQGYARIAVRNDHAGEQPDGVEALRAWSKAQRLGLTDHDPLFDAIMNYNRPDLPLMGTAKEIIKTLEQHHGELPNQGGGKAIARKIREMKPQLLMAGITVQEEVRSERAYFTIRRDSPMMKEMGYTAPRFAPDDAL